MPYTLLTAMMAGRKGHEPEKVRRLIIARTEEDTHDEMPSGQNDAAARESRSRVGEQKFPDKAAGRVPAFHELRAYVRVHGLIESVHEAFDAVDEPGCGSEVPDHGVIGEDSQRHGIGGRVDVDGHCGSEDVEAVGKGVPDPAPGRENKDIAELLQEQHKGTDARRGQRTGQEQGSQNVIIRSPHEEKNENESDRLRAHIENSDVVHLLYSLKEPDGEYGIAHDKKIGCPEKLRVKGCAHAAGHGDRYGGQSRYK